MQILFRPLRFQETAATVFILSINDTLSVSIIVLLFEMNHVTKGLLKGSAKYYTDVVNQ